MSDFSDWEELRAELHDGDDAALETERERTMAWGHAFHPAAERKCLAQRDAALLMSITRGRVSQID